MNPPDLPQDPPPPLQPQEPEPAIDPQELLRRKFPDMKPMGGTPALFTLNGFGLSMSGRRNVDVETGTYVKSHCITALFVPVLTLGSYRVADAETGGWYFVGKVPKSGFAKAWNTMLLSAIVLMIGFGWWSAKKNSPEAKAAQRMEEAAEHSAAGRHLEAAGIYWTMMIQKQPSWDKATEELKNVLTLALQSDSPDTVAKAVGFAANLPSRYTGSSGFLPDLPKLAMEGAERFAKDQPADSLRIVEAAEGLSAPPDKLGEKKEELLTRLVASDPDKMDYAVGLAGILEASGRVDEALALLKPRKDKLGTGEGARILGQLLLARGQAAEAATLLERYIEPRLKKWRGAEATYQRAAEAAYQRVVDMLNRNEGPKSFYAKYNAAKNEAEESEIVDEYVYEQMQRDAQFQRAGRAYEQAGGIVPVLMDLGISELQAAQGITDPARRKELLDKAEQRFLSLKETTGETDEFKFFLGQVYYWSGRQDEGRTLFDSLLASSRRSFPTLLTLSSTFREIGNTTEARTLAEEAYGKASGQEEKDAAAGQRALLYTDIDDQIDWLEKRTGGDLMHTTQLAGARADKAQSEGDTAAAIKQLRIAEDGWAKLPVSASTLNNGALVQFSLFSLTGEISCHEEGSRMMERAVALQPENSILLSNAASSLAGTAMMRLAKGKLHPRIIQDGIGFESLRCLYHDEPTRDVLTDKLAADDQFQRAMELLDRALLLAPNNKELYTLAAAYGAYVHDFERLERVTTQLQSARFDHSAAIEELETFMRGENDDKLREAVQTGVKHQGEVLAAVDDPDQRRHVLVNLADVRLSLFHIGEAVDLDKEISFLREAVREDPCTRHGNVLTKALSQKANLALAEESAAYAKLLNGCRRYVNETEILILALTSAELRPVVLAHAGAREALTEYVLRDDPFPSTRLPATVIAIGALFPDRLAEARQQVASNRFYRPGELVSTAVMPSHPNRVVRRYLELVAAGKDAEARAVLDEARAAGTTVPAI